MLEAMPEGRLRANPKVEVIMEVRRKSNGHDYMRRLLRKSKRSKTAGRKTKVLESNRKRRGESLNRNDLYKIVFCIVLKDRKDSSTHLENCTGRDKTKTVFNLFQLVLGDELNTMNWQDQANKSAGWMPGH